ncbi:MAG: cobalamin biosynthesis protein CbiM [Candidatus Eisenbacteria bacterium]|nr:cobalamin biosynthesis protein CbiM [Candidatus Eisenbacteria bacterium]
MHIPDGFISPKVYLPAYGVGAALWAVGILRLGRSLRAQMVPFLSVTTAVAFVLMTILLPLPGGTSIHASGIGMIAVLFGPWVSFLCLSLVLLLQVFLLGEGGITSFPVNALAMGLIGSLVAWAVYRLLRRWNLRLALFLAGWSAVCAAALVVAVVLGIQPAIAHRADGTPLFFPFGLEVTLPAILVPHALVGIAEGILTILAYEFFGRRMHTLSR